jgi:hypothetical protein
VRAAVPDHQRRGGHRSAQADARRLVSTTRSDASQSYARGSSPSLSVVSLRRESPRGAANPYRESRKIYTDRSPLQGPRSSISVQFAEFCFSQFAALRGARPGTLHIVWLRSARVAGLGGVCCRVPRRRPARWPQSGRCLSLRFARIGVRAREDGPGSSRAASRESQSRRVTRCVGRQGQATG